MLFTNVLFNVIGEKSYQDIIALSGHSRGIFQITTSGCHGSVLLPFFSFLCVLKSELNVYSAFFETKIGKLNSLQTLSI